MAVYNVDKSDHTSTLRCKPGDLINVTLPENPTTGYKWHVIESEGLTLNDDSFELGSRSDSHNIGSGGQRVLSFKFTGPDRATLHLEHYQAWEGADSSDDSFSLTVA